MISRARSARAAAAARPRRARSRSTPSSARATTTRCPTRRWSATIPGTRSGRRRHRLQLPSRSREAGRERQRERLLGESRDRADAEDADRREAHPAAGADDPLHLAVGDDRHDRLSDEIPGDRGANPRRRAPRHGRRRSVHHQIGAARDAVALVDRHGDRRCRRSVRPLRDRRRVARRRRRRHDARDPIARRIEGRVLGRHHALRERQRSLDLSGGRASRSRRSICAIIPTSTSTPPATSPTTSSRPRSSARRSSRLRAATTWRRCPIAALR